MTNEARSDTLLHAVTHTLDKMSAGGIDDHLGGGFHRYSVDERWLVPHFEKMLYDYAQLVSCYVDACLATGNEDYARVARETFVHEKEVLRVRLSGGVSQFPSHGGTPVELLRAADEALYRAKSAGGDRIERA